MFWRKVSQHTDRTKMRRGLKRLASSSSQQKRSRSTSRVENITESDDGESRVLRSDTAQSRGSRSKSHSRSQSIHSRELSDHSSDSSSSSDSSKSDNADQQPQDPTPHPAQSRGSQASSVSSNVQIQQALVEYDRLEIASSRREFEADLVRIVQDTRKWAEQRVCGAEESLGASWMIAITATASLWHLMCHTLAGTDSRWCAKRLNRAMAASFGVTA